MDLIHDAFRPRPYVLRDTYLRTSAFEGTIHTEGGQRVMVLPEELIQGLHRAVEHETGRAASLILYGCGRRWGERMIERWRGEWREYYDAKIEDADYTAFEAFLVVVFADHGWGSLEVDFAMAEEGLLEFRLRNSVFARLITGTEQPVVDHIFTGFFAAIASAFSGETLDAIEIASTRSGAPACRFIVALPDRIDRARERALDGATGDELLATLRSS
ncbi:MAG: hypothetical protein EA398_07620 [Deltaproteobacteria bacterium]|nr:MAG: hypothetical protein EA398_07620 [Deltaproteobacteria bacterium]